MEQIIGLVEKFPQVAGILSAMYVGGLAIKAIQSAAKAFVASTPSESDDKKLVEIESGKVYKSIVYLVDLVTRLKLPKA